MTELPSETARLNARLNALDRFDRSERRFYLFGFMLTAVEILFIWGFAQLADFSNRLHVLIFWSLLSSYAPMMIGLGVLWAHISRSTRLVLKAIDLSTRKVPVETARSPNPLGLDPDR
jgi:hypothetical protein